MAVAKIAKSSNRGSKPGERRGGRAKGTPNKTTADIKAVAQQYGAEALMTLVRLSREADTDQAKIAASKEVLDRAYGKPSQVLAGDPENPLSIVQKIEMVGVRP